MTTMVIAGLGRIGAGNLDLAGAIPMSHLSAALSVSGIDVVGLVDASQTQLDEISYRYSEQITNVALAKNFETLGINRCDVVVIATPPEARLAAVEDALKLNPRLLLLEKPISKDFASAVRIVEIVRSAGAELRVNFHRRFDRRHLRWQNCAPKNPILITMRYSKGLLNYGSHLIDFLMDWYGPIGEVQAISDLQPTLTENDSVLSFRCRMSAGFEAIILGLSELQYDQHEIDIFASDSRVEIAAGGAEYRWHRPVADKHYIGYNHLEVDESKLDLGPVGGFCEAYEAINDFISRGTKLAGCTGIAAIANSAVLEAALRSAELGKIKIVPEIPAA